MPRPGSRTFKKLSTMVTRQEFEGLLTLCPAHSDSRILILYYMIRENEPAALDELSSLLFMIGTKIVQTEAKITALNQLLNRKCGPSLTYRLTWENEEIRKEWQERRYLFFRGTMT